VFSEKLPASLRAAAPKKVCLTRPDCRLGALPQALHPSRAHKARTGSTCAEVRARHRVVGSGREVRHWNRGRRVAAGKVWWMPVGRAQERSQIVEERSSESFLEDNPTRFDVTAVPDRGCRVVVGAQVLVFSAELEVSRVSLSHHRMLSFLVLVRSHAPVFS
jgi:hypothetical protein